MSDPVSVLNGAKYAGLAEVTEAGLSGMITLRGDLGSASVKSAVKSATGVDIPERRKIAIGDSGAAAWMSPDELLLLVDYAAAEETVTALSEALKGEHFAATNVSDARARFSIGGDKAREVIAKIAPVDLEPAKFAAGDFRRTRFAQVPAAFWLDHEGEFHIVCFRSVGQYMFDLLKVAANPKSGVGVY